MEKNKTNSKRKKPEFVRKDWHKRIKLGSTVKKKRKWRAAVGVHNKIRLGVKGHISRPKIGFGSSKEVKELRVENIKDLEKFDKNRFEGIIIGNIGKKKRDSILNKAREMKIDVLNKYKQVKNKSGENKNATSE